MELDELSSLHTPPFKGQTSPTIKAQTHEAIPEFSSARALHLHHCHRKASVTLGSMEVYLPSVTPSGVSCQVYKYTDRSWCQVGGSLSWVLQGPRGLVGMGTGEKPSLWAETLAGPTGLGGCSCLSSRGSGGCHRLPTTVWSRMCNL